MESKTYENNLIQFRFCVCAMLWYDLIERNESKNMVGIVVVECMGECEKNHVFRLSKVK